MLIVAAEPAITAVIGVRARIDEYSVDCASPSWVSTSVE
jgi:hypothetical protein